MWRGLLTESPASDGQDAVLGKVTNWGFLCATAAIRLFDDLLSLPAESDGKDWIFPAEVRHFAGTGDLPPPAAASNSGRA